MLGMVSGVACNENLLYDDNVFVDAVRRHVPAIVAHEHVGREKMAALDLNHIWLDCSGCHHHSLCGVSCNVRRQQVSPYIFFDLTDTPMILLMQLLDGHGS